MKVTKSCDITIKLNCYEARILSNTLLRAMNQQTIAHLAMGWGLNGNLLKSEERDIARKVVAALGRTEEGHDCFRENEEETNND